MPASVRGRPELTVSWLHACSTCREPLAQLHGEGYTIDLEAVAALSPYRTSHLDRLGRYTLDVTREPLPLEYNLPTFTTASS